MYAFYFVQARVPVINLMHGTGMKLKCMIVATILSDTLLARTG
jgi:hypothetical protein